jgi:outer membrane protein assembly factor BamA
MFIESSYIPHTILGASYGLTLTNQQSPDYHTFSYWAKMNVESAGALLYAGTSLLNTSRDADGYRSFLGRPFSQYVRADLDFRLYQFLGGSSGLSKMVYRFYLGVGSPYANSSVLPFEKRFYSGGAYGIRGWRIYSLGPGSFRDPNTSYSSTGDIRLEFNVENRFKLFWILEGALFVDAGNVWDAKKDPKRPGANFEWNRFLSEMAVSSGFGLRFDFSFVVGRFDVGIKMRDPVDGFLWNRGILMDDITYNFGIGYPF